MTSAALVSPRELFRRRLAPSEAVYCKNSTTGNMSLLGKGRIDAEVLRQAFQAVCDETRELQGRIEKTPEGHDFVVFENPPPAVVEVTEGDPAPFVYSRDSVLGLAQPLVAVRVVRSAERYRLTVLTHHALFDGMLNALVAWRLLSQYNALEQSGELLPFEPAPFRKPLEDLLAERGIAAGPISGVEEALAAALGPAGPLVLDAERPRQVSFRLTKDETSQFRKIAKSRGSTVHGVLCGVIARAVHRLAGSPPELKIPILSLVHIRDRVEPPVPITDGTVMLGTSGSLVIVTAERDAVEIGQKVVDELREGLRTGVVQQSHLHAHKLSSAADKEKAAGSGFAPNWLVGISNVGSLPTLPAPDGTIIEDIRAMSAHLTPADLGEQGQPEAKANSNWFAVFTAEGALNMEFKVRNAGTTLDADLPIMRALRASFDEVFELALLK